MSSNTHTVIAFMKRKEGMSLEAFYRYWEEVHGPLVKPWAEKYGMTYKQVRLVPGGDPKLSEFDGIAVFEMSEPDAFKRASVDPYYAEKLNPDTPFFMQTTTMFTGGETVTIT